MESFEPIFNYNNNANGDERKADLEDNKKGKKEKKGLGRFFSKRKSHTYMLEIPDEPQNRLHKSKSLDTVAELSHRERRISEPEKESKSSAFGKLFGKKSKRESIPEERIPSEAQTKEQIPQSTNTMERASSVEYSPAEFLPAEPIFYAMAEPTTQQVPQHTTTTEAQVSVQPRIIVESTESKLAHKKRRAPPPPSEKSRTESVPVSSSPVRVEVSPVQHQSLEQIPIESETIPLEEASTSVQSIETSLHAISDGESDDEPNLSDISANIQQMPLPRGSPPPKPKRLSLDAKLLLRISETEQDRLLESTSETTSTNEVTSEVSSQQESLQRIENEEIPDTAIKLDEELSEASPNLISSEEISSVLAGFEFNESDQESPPTPEEVKSEITVSPVPEITEMERLPTRLKSDSDIPSLSIVRHMAQEALASKSEKSAEIKNILRRSMARMMGVSQEETTVTQVTGQTTETEVTLKLDSQHDLKLEPENIPSMENVINESPVDVNEVQQLSEPPGKIHLLKETDEGLPKIKLETSVTPVVKAAIDNDSTSYTATLESNAPAEIFVQPIGSENYQIVPERSKGVQPLTPSSSEDEEEPPSMSRSGLSRSKSMAELSSPRDRKHLHTQSKGEPASEFSEFLKSRRQMLRPVESKGGSGDTGSTVRKLVSKSTKSEVTARVEIKPVEVPVTKADVADDVFAEPSSESAPATDFAKPPDEPVEDDAVMQSMKKWKLRRAKSIGSLVLDPKFREKMDEEKIQHQAAEEELKKRTKAVRDRTQRILEGIKADRAITRLSPSDETRESRTRSQHRLRRKSTPNLDTSLDAFLKSEQQKSEIRTEQVQQTRTANTTSTAQTFPSSSSGQTVVVREVPTPNQSPPPSQVRTTRKVKRKTYVFRRSVGTDVISNPASDTEATAGYDSSDEDASRRPAGRLVSGRLDSGFSDIASSHEGSISAHRTPIRHNISTQDDNQDAGRWAKQRSSPTQRVSPTPSVRAQRTSPPISASMTDASKNAINMANDDFQQTSGESVPDDVKEFMSLDRTELQKIILQQQQEMRLLRQKMETKQQPAVTPAEQAPQVLPPTTTPANVQQQPQVQQQQQQPMQPMPFMYMMPTPKGMMPMFYMPQNLQPSGMQQTPGMQMPAAGMSMQMPGGMQMPAGMPGMMPMGSFPFGGMPMQGNMAMAGGMTMPGMAMAPQAVYLSDHSGQSD